MALLRAPNPDFDGFQLLGREASREAWEVAFTAIRRIDLTWPQIIDGYRASMLAAESMPDILRLRTWCGDRGLRPADVTAEAILVRMSAVIAMCAQFPSLDAEIQRSVALRDLRVENDVQQFVGSRPWNEGAPR